MAGLVVEVRSRGDAEWYQRNKESMHPSHVLLKNRINLSGNILIWDGSRSKTKLQTWASGRADRQIGDWDKGTI